MSAELTRLLTGYYNPRSVDPVTNPGGFGNDGHEKNLAAMLADVAVVATDVASQSGTATIEADAAHADRLLADADVTAAAGSVTAAAAIAAGIAGTSTTAQAIATGSVTLASQTGKQWRPGMFVIAVDHASPTTRWISGYCTAYDSVTTGNLTFFVNPGLGSTLGSGTPAQYDIFISGPVGATGPQGKTGGGVSDDITFDTGTANSDPGTGKLRLNSATQNAATAIYISTTDINGTDLTALLDQLDASSSVVKGQGVLTRKIDDTHLMTFNLLSRIAHTGYRELQIVITAYSSANPFSASDELVLLFTRSGDNGNSSDNVLTADGGGIILNLNTEYDLDSSAGTLTQVSLPPTPTSEGQWVALRDIADMLDIFPVTVLRNGHNIYDPSTDAGSAADLDLTMSGSRTKFVWRQALGYWKPEVE